MRSEVKIIIICTAKLLRRLFGKMRTKVQKNKKDMKDFKLHSVFSESIAKHCNLDNAGYA
jgi:hypothetical protein